MIGRFPLFSELDINHKAEVEHFTEKFDPYSDFNFISLFSWNTDGKTEISNLNDNLVIKLSDYLTGDTVYSLLGDNQIDSTLNSLLATVNVLHLVPDVVAKNIHDKSGFQIDEDRNNFDYIYNTEKLASLQGQSLKKKRNKVNRFEKTVSDIGLEVRTLRSFDTAHRNELELLCEKWTRSGKRKEVESITEREAIKRLLDNFDALNLMLIEIIIGESLSAFSVNEVIDNGFAICHFEKAADFNEDNIYTYLSWKTAQALEASGCKYVNWEQDLGLEGLRQSKLSFHPDRYLVKHTVSKA